MTYTRRQMKRFIGKYAYGIYPAPAISCEMNGRLICVDGAVTGIGKDGMGRVGIIIEGTVFRLSEVKCPTLHWEGDAYTIRFEAREGARKERQRKWREAINES